MSLLLCTTVSLTLVCLLNACVDCKVFLFRVGLFTQALFWQLKRKKEESDLDWIYFVSFKSSRGGDGQKLPALKEDGFRKFSLVWEQSLSVTRRNNECLKEVIKCLEELQVIILAQVWEILFAPLCQAASHLPPLLLIKTEEVRGRLVKNNVSYLWNGKS